MITLEQIPILAIPSMNDTHLEESLIINRLGVAVSNDDIDDVYLILRELLEHTRVHYSDEEALMDKISSLEVKVDKIANEKRAMEGELTDAREEVEKESAARDALQTEIRKLIEQLRKLGKLR